MGVGVGSRGIFVGMRWMGNEDDLIALPPDAALWNSTLVVVATGETN